ncbi:MAG: CorA family divalent cation transporter [Pseudomonadota bacterium]
MLRAYAIEQNRLTPVDPSLDRLAGPPAVWIDMVNPSKEELHIVERFSAFPLPNIKETQEIEASSHYEIYNHGFQINCLFLHQQDGRFVTTNAAFLCSETCLISMCAKDLSSIRLLQQQYEKNVGPGITPLSIIIGLIETKIEKLADLSEEAYLAIERIGRQIFGRDSTELEKTIDDLSRQDDLIGKMRLCLMDGQRDLNFLIRRIQLLPDNLSDINNTLEDIKTLLSHNAYISERIDFLLNAALGFINIEQNKIIKIFSIAAVVFMPPTVVASIFGMNFHFMPELSMPWGYPLSLILMVVSGISPYIYFKRKGWL